MANRRRYELYTFDSASLAVHCRDCDEDVAYHVSPVGVEEELEEDMERHDKVSHDG